MVADGVLIRPVQPRLSLAIWINHNPRPAARGKTTIPFWCFRPPHPMGLLSDRQLDPVLEIVGQIPGFAA